MMKQVVVPIFILVVGLAAILFFTVKNFSKKIEAPKKEVKVETFVLQHESVSDELEFFGNIQANMEANLSAKVSGRVSSINFDEGDVVKKGVLLAYLSPDQYGLDYRKKSKISDNFENYKDKQQAYLNKQVKIAEENLDEKEEELNYNKLNDPSRVSIAEENVDKAKDELETAKRQRDAQKKSLIQQSDSFISDIFLSAQYLTDSRITSPFKGVVTKKYLEVGEVVAAGQPIIAVANISLLKVVVEVPDTLIDRLSVGLGARVLMDGVSGEYSAKVTRVNPRVNPVSKKIEVEITLDAVPQGAKIDMFARVFIKFPQKTAYFVPNNFIFSDFEGPYVTLDNGRQQFIKRGEEEEGRTEIIFDGIVDNIKILRNFNGREE